MSTLILENIKKAIGILPDNVGFDTELLMFINSTVSSLVQLGVEDMNIVVDKNTIWPTFQDPILENLTKHYIQVKIRQTFDPTTSETMAKTLANTVMELEGRMIHEVQEVPYVP